MSKTDIAKIMVVLSGLGALLSMYLLYTTRTGDYGLCPTNGCQIVGSSEYSYFIGIPVAFWGLGYYCVLMLPLLNILNGKNYSKNIMYIGVLLLVGTIFTLYLRYLEFFVIEAVCFWCWGSVLTIVSLLISYFFLKRSKG